MSLNIGGSFGFQSSQKTGGGGGGNPIVVLAKGVVLTTDATSFDFLSDYFSVSALAGAVSVNFNASSLLQRDGSVGLTADWNAGAYGITANNFTSNIGFNFITGLGGSLVSASTTTSAKTWTLPNNSGIIALTSDIPLSSNFVKTDGSTPLVANWNAGAYGIRANTFTANNGFTFNNGSGGLLVSSSTSSLKTWTFPDTTGTIALTSDIPSLTEYLKANGSVPLTSNWNAGSYEITANKFIGNNGFGFNVGLGGSLVSASTTGSAKTWTLPNVTGTIALTSDIPSLSGYLKADGTIPLTANWNAGSYELTANKFIGNNGFGFNVGLGGSLVSATTTGSAKTWTLPNVTGTIALTDSPNFTGTPTAPTPTIGDDSTKIATTEFVQDAIATGSIPYGTIFSQTTFNFLT
jgi:hypothetical protein